eukprot:9890526-Ditylum_brightwellii.AAC.1
MSTPDRITPFLQDNKKYETLPDFILPSMQVISSDVNTANTRQFAVHDLFGGANVHDVVAKLCNHVLEGKGLSPNITADIESLQVVDYTNDVALIAEKEGWCNVGSQYHGTI